ncbi:ABC transporter permease [Chitinophaga sp. 30R24]|uniref:ABC transporter permease n=1 Tax=Chitinophaga sp. 30R24 TaxID=3248838 RepID=UPI003B8FFA52
MDNYLYGRTYENGVQTGGRISNVKLFSLIALFILVIACINFMNLSTAKSAGRMKEIGIRKAMGARRVSLVTQYMVESVLMAYFSLAIALLIVWLLLPYFNSITGKASAMQPDLRIVLVFMYDSQFFARRRPMSQMMVPLVYANIEDALFGF